MKKISLFALLAAGLVLVGCGSSDTPSTQNDFANADCNKFFEVLQCVVDAQTGVSVEDIAATNEAIAQQKEDWKALSEEDLSAVCTSSMEDIRTDADIYTSFGCSVD